MASIAVCAVPNAVMQDDQLPGIDGADMLQGLDPPHPAHSNVEKDNVGRRLFHGGNGFLAARCSGDNVVAGREHPRERVPDLGVVVDDENCGFGGRHRQKRGITVAGGDYRLAIRPKRALFTANAWMVN